MLAPAALFTRARARSPLLDHLVRTYGRYQADSGDRLAASVTFYWFLSLFPILLLAIYLLRLVKGDAAAGDVSRGLSGYLPKELVKTIATTIGDKAGKAGLIGAIGLLLAGLGWINALREAIRTVWHHNVSSGNVVVRKLIDVATLIGLFVTVGASVSVTGFAASGPAFLLEQLGVNKTGAAVLLTRAVGIGLGIVADTFLFLFLFVRLARVTTPVREVLKGAIFGAVCFAVIKLVGSVYVQRTTGHGQATYGAFAVVVGLLLFLNLLSRFVLLSSAFVVTSPYDSDVPPSGTADPEQRKTASPQEPSGVDEGDQRLWSRPEVAPPDGPRSTVAALPDLSNATARPKGAAQVQLAATASAAALGLGVLAVFVYGLRTLSRAASR